MTAHKAVLSDLVGRRGLDPDGRANVPEASDVRRVLVQNSQPGVQPKAKRNDMEAIAAIVAYRAKTSRVTRSML